MRIGNNMVAAAGEYLVCAELCRQNVLALVTPKNNPIFDVLASDPTGGRSVAIQVKTMSLRNDQGWKMGRDMAEPQANPMLYVVLVNMKSDGTNDFYIYERDQLSERVQRVYEDYMATPKKDGSPKKPVSFRWLDFRHFTVED